MESTNSENPIDEAHTLNRQVGGSTLYDSMIKAFARFLKHSLYAVPFNCFGLRESCKSVKAVSSSHRDLFDCHENFPLSPGMKLENIVDLEFLFRYGRPL